MQSAQLLEQWTRQVPATAKGDVQGPAAPASLNAPDMMIAQREVPGLTRGCNPKNEEQWFPNFLEENLRTNGSRVLNEVRHLRAISAVSSTMNIKALDKVEAGFMEQPGFPQAPPPQALSAPPVKKLPAALQKISDALATAKSKSSGATSSSGAWVPVPQHLSKPSLPDFDQCPALVSKAALLMSQRQLPVRPHLLSKVAFWSVRPKAAQLCARPKPTRCASRSRSRGGRSGPVSRVQEGSGPVYRVQGP